MSNTNSNKLGNNGGRFYAYPFQPVWIDCNFIVDATNGSGLGIRSLKGGGVQNVFMHTSASPGKGKNGYLNPNPAPGYALIQLNNNYSKYLGGFSGFVSPLAGSNIAINSTALTIGNPYVIVSAGVGSAGTVTIAPVADVSGSLASTYFTMPDGYGNQYVIWFSVSGVGSAPKGVSGTLIQQSISSGATAAQVGTALAITIGALLAAQPGNLSAPAGVFSYTATGTTTVTVVSTANAPLPGGPQDGAIATGFTFAVTKSKSNNQNWANVGLPPGVLPNIGASFIATATGDTTLGTSTGLVQASTVSGITSIEVIGDANQSMGPVPVGGSPNVGGWILVQMLGATSSSVTTLIPTAPAAGSTVGMSFFVNARL